MSDPGNALTAALEESPELCLGPADDGRSVSSAAFAAAHFIEPWTFERVAGRLEVMSPEGWEHVAMSEPWRDRLGAYALLRPDLIRRVVSQVWVRIDPATDRIGDIGVYLVGEGRDLVIPDLIPDLIFEFVSPTLADRRRDYIEKRADYERAGIREYVIVDRFDRKVTVLTLRAGSYAERVVPRDGTYQTPLLPGFEVPLAGIWPR